MNSLIRGRFRLISNVILKQTKGGYSIPHVVITRKWVFSLHDT